MRGEDSPTQSVRQIRKEARKLREGVKNTTSTMRREMMKTAKERREERRRSHGSP